MYLINQKLAGNIIVFSSVICLAIATVLTHQILKDINPIVFAFYCFISVIIIDIFIKFIFLPNKNDFIYKKDNLKHIFLLNLFTAIDWVFYIVTLKFLGPSFTNALVFGISPIASLILSQKFDKTHFGYSLLILIILILMAIHHINYHTNHIKFLLGVFFALISGLAIGCTAISIKALSNQCVDIINVITTRYIIALITSLSIALISHTDLTINVINLFKIFTISVLFILLPSFFVQKGAKYISAFNLSAIGASTPAFTYMFFIIVNKSYSIPQLVYIFILWVVLLKLTAQKDYLDY